MASNKGQKRKHSAGYYVKSAKHVKKGRQLDKGMRGFILTCNMREREATSEAYSLLNEYANSMYGEEDCDMNDKDDAMDDVEEDEEEDIEKAAQREIESIKRQAKSTQRRFQAVDSGARNIIFIQTTLDKPLELMDKMMNDLLEKKQQKSRHIMRIIAVVGTCHVKNIKEQVKDILQPIFDADRIPRFRILFKARNNTDVKRDECIRSVIKVIQELDPDCKPDYNQDDFVVNVDVIKSIVLVGIMKEFKKYKKYNLQELIGGTGGDMERGNKSKGGEKGAEDISVAEDAKTEGEKLLRIMKLKQKLKPMEIMWKVEMLFKKKKIL